MSEGDAVPSQGRQQPGQKRKGSTICSSVPAKRAKFRATSCWPTSTMNKPRRSQALWAETVEQVAKISKTREFDKTKGIKGIRRYTPFLELAKWGFNIVFSIPTEIMHALDEVTVLLLL